MAREVFLFVLSSTKFDGNNEKRTDKTVLSTDVGYFSKTSSIRISINLTVAQTVLITAATTIVQLLRPTIIRGFRRVVRRIFVGTCFYFYRF